MTNVQPNHQSLCRQITDIITLITDHNRPAVFTPTKGNSYFYIHIKSYLCMPFPGKEKSERMLIIEKRNY